MACFRVGNLHGVPYMFTNLNNNIVEQAMTFPETSHPAEKAVHLSTLGLDVVTQISCTQPFRVGSQPGSSFGVFELERSTKHDDVWVVKFERGFPRCSLVASTFCAKQCDFVVFGAVYSKLEQARLSMALRHKHNLVFVQLSWTVAAMNDTQFGVGFAKHPGKTFFPPGWPGRSAAVSQADRDIWNALFEYDNDEHFTPPFVRHGCSSWNGFPPKWTRSNRAMYASLFDHSDHSDQPTKSGLTEPELACSQGKNINELVELIERHLDKPVVELLEHACAALTECGCDEDTFDKLVFLLAKLIGCDGQTELDDQSGVTLFDQPGLMLLVCALLCRIVRTDDRAAKCQQAGFVEKLFRVLDQHYQPELLEQACCALRGMTNTTTCNQNQVEVLIEVINNFYNEPELLEQACAVLRNVSRTGVCCQAVTALVGVVKADNQPAGLLQEACAALCNMMDNSAEFVVSGGVEALLCIIKRHTNMPELVLSACTVLRNMRGNDETQARANKAGAVETLIQVIRHNTDCAVQASACAALLNIVGSNADNITKCGQVGGVELLVEVVQHYVDHHDHAVHDDSAESASFACAVLSNISHNSDTRTACSRAGAIELLVQVINKHVDHHADPTKLLETACHALVNMTNSNNDNATRCIQAGAVDSLVQLVQQLDNPELARLACAVLRNVSHIQAFKSSQPRTAEAMVRVLTLVDQSPKMLESACVVLHNFGTNKHNRSRCVEAGAVEALVRLMRHHVDDVNTPPELLGWACKTLHTIGQGFSGLAAPQCWQVGQANLFQNGRGSYDLMD